MRNLLIGLVPAVFINPEPESADAFRAAVHMEVAPASSRTMVGAAMSGGRMCPLWSSLAEDVDYEMAVQWMARKLGLVKDLPESARRHRSRPARAI
jgi:hypothetical protein